MKENIVSFKEHVFVSLNQWIDNRVDAFVAGNPRMAKAAVYLKRGAKNFLVQKKEKFDEMIDYATMFICNENGEINKEMLFSDLMYMFKNMDDMSFTIGPITGTAGKGTIRFQLPEGLFSHIFFGNTGAIRITEADLQKLKDMLVKEP